MLRSHLQWWWLAGVRLSSRKCLLYFIESVPLSQRVILPDSFSCYKTKRITLTESPSKRSKEHPETQNKRASRTLTVSMILNSFFMLFLHSLHFCSLNSTFYFVARHLWRCFCSFHWQGKVMLKISLLILPLLEGSEGKWKQPDFWWHSLVHQAPLDGREPALFKGKVWPNTYKPGFWKGHSWTWLHHLPAMRLWANYLALLSFSFLIYKRRL